MRAASALQMAEILQRHFGDAIEDVPPATWTGLLKTVLTHGRPIAGKARDWAWLGNSGLGTVPEAVAAGPAEWETALESAGCNPKKAVLLVRLARWWCDEFGADDPGIALSRKSLAHWQTQLRSIRGVSWELADLILLTLRAGPVYPLDRGSRRIVLRHGWLDLSADYDEWQSFFSGLAGDARVSLPWLWTRTSDVGRKYCGSQPKCDECPLRGILPEHGPVQFDGDD